MKFKPLLFLAVFIAAIFIRFVKIEQVPPALYYDEIDLGLQIRSLLQTGKDYRNEISPFYFRSFNTDKTPIPVLFSALTSLAFKTPELQIRAGTAIVGIFVVGLSMVISWQLTASYLASLVTGLVFAFSPWMIHFSRMAFEAEYSLLFIFLFLALFFQWRKNKKSTMLYFSALILGLSVYTYRTMSFLAPVLLAVTFLFYYKDFFALGLKKCFLWLGICFFVMAPFLYATTIGSKDETRISQISIFSDPTIVIDIQRSREMVSGNFQNPSLGQKPSFRSKVFHNKLVSILEKFRNNTFNNFSPDFLFLSGDQNGRHSAKNTGEMLFVDSLGLLAGIYYLLKKRKEKNYLFLFFLLFLGAVPSNLTVDGANHASRLISFAGPLLLITSLGYFSLLNSLISLKYGKYLVLILVAIWIFSVAEYTNKYFYHFPIKNAREFGYGFKQAVLKINQLKDNYRNISLTDTNDPPIPYYLYWSNTSIKDLQQYGSDFSPETIKKLPLDKVKPQSFKIAFCDTKGIVQLRPDTIYLVSDKNLPLDFRAIDKDPVPQGVKLLDTIKYPDNEVAFYLITRDSKDGKAIEPLATEKCK